MIHHALHGLRFLFGKRTYLLLAMIIGISYAVAFGYGTGMVVFYPTSVEPLMQRAGLSIPYVATEFRGIPSWTNPSIIWFPSGNLELVLYLGPTVSLVAMSVLMGMNSTSLIYRYRNQIKSSGPAGFGGVLSVIPFFATAGCGCSVPLLTAIAGTAIPAAALSSFQFQFGWLVNLVAGIVMVGMLTISAERLDRSMGECNLRDKDSQLDSNTK